MDSKRWGTVMNRESASEEQSTEFLTLARDDPIISAYSEKEWSDSRILKYLTAHKLNQTTAINAIHNTIKYFDSISWPSLGLVSDDQFSALDATG
jgi:hypothetical protein